MKAKLAVIILTAYLVVYAVICDTGFSVTISSCMFILSPFLLVLCVYFILNDKTYKYPDLGKDEEWGYRDRTKD